MNVANVPSHPPIFDWNLMKQIYYKRIFIKDSLKYFANTYRRPLQLTVSGGLSIVSHKKCMILNMSANF